MAHAIRQHSFGGPETLHHEEVPDPEPGPGQVRVAVRAAGVHLIDTVLRQGQVGGPPRPDPPELPVTPGREVAGVVDALGPGTDPTLSGQRVVVHLGPAGGGYASAAVADAADLLALDDHVGFAEAVAMVGTGRTAMAIVEVAGPGPQDVALVTAAAGGIGSLLVQHLRGVGATVVAAAGGAAKVALAEGLGAEVAVDYSDPGWTGEVRGRLGGREITLALDGVAGALGRGAFELVGPGGRMVMYGYASGEEMPLTAGDLYARGVTVAPAIGRRLAARPGGLRPLAARALAELSAGRLAPLIHPPFALADAADAHRAIEGRATAGKVVLVTERS